MDLVREFAPLRLVEEAISVIPTCFNDQGMAIGEIEFTMEAVAMPSWAPDAD
jgi:hypothetical protein